MATKWQDKGVGVSLLRGTANPRVILDERFGTVGGYEVDHWDDHRDANVLARTIRASLAVNEDKPSHRPPPASPEEIRIIQEILKRRVNDGL